MSEGTREELGYLKYSGEDLDEGIIDAGSAGAALVGLDEAIRYFNIQQSPDFSTLEYDVPVLTREGSWEAVLPAGAGVAGAFALGYAKKAGEKLAENDFKDIGLKHALSKSMSALKALAKLIKESRRSNGWEVKRIEPEGPIDWAVVAGPNGSEVRVQFEYLGWYQRMPPRLLSHLTAALRADRTLTIALHREPFSEAVVLDASDKPLFERFELEEVEEGFLFPELEHGQKVRLIGRLVRGNESANSLGLEYEKHIINCHPATGRVRRYKSALFLRCQVEGRVTRHTKANYVADRRPTLILDNVIPLERDGQEDLFQAPTE